MAELIKPSEKKLEKKLDRNSPLRTLIKMFRTNTVVKHHFQSPRSEKPIGVAKAFFKSGYNFNSSVIPGYGEYDRFARYSDYAEMESYPILNKALDIFADETTQKDEEGNIIRVVSEKKEIAKILQELFDDILHLSGKEIYKLARNLCKYGDVFYLIDATEEHGVVNLIMMPANEVEREEGFDKDEPTAVRFRWTSRNNIEIPNAYVAHFRLDGNDLFKPYGQSCLESARRPWRQLVLLEDAMMVYRITRAPERRVYYLDVMGIPPENIEEVVKKFNETIKKEKVVNEQGRIDLRYGATLPVWKKTPIPLLDGRTISIEELAREYEKGKENWVYSIKDDTLETVPGKVVWCGKNYTAEKMVKVWLDDETWSMMAPEHPVLMKDGSSKAAKDLIPGESVMPLYRKRSNIKDGYKIKDYDLVYDMKTKSYKFTHRIVANKILHEQRENVRKTTDWRSNRNLIVHHKDFNRLNNSPSNLRWMGNKDHFLLHAENKENAIKNIMEWNDKNKVRPQVSKLNKERDSIQHMKWYNHSVLHEEHNEIRKEAQLKSWNDKDSRNQRMKTHSKIELSDEHLQKIYEVSKKIFEENEKLSRDKFGILLNQENEFINVLKEAQVSAPKGGKYSMHIRTLLRHLGMGYPEFKKCAKNDGLNHKVLRIEYVDFVDDVYCMTVVGPDGEDDRHNFAIQTFDLNGKKAQSFHVVKNSMEEDYVIPVRGQDSGTRIDTLPGGQNASDIEDIEFIKKNLFSALGIPKAFLTFDEDIGAKSILTHEDIRFARTISRIQEAIINELLKIAIIHLYLKGIRGEDLVNFEIKMTNPSTVAELQKNELWRARMELVQQAGEGVFDTTFIYKNFLHLTDDAIDMIRKGQIMDKLFQSKLMQLEGGMGMMGGMGMGGMGMGGMGMGMDMGMGGLGGAAPNVGGLPPMPMESFNPAASVTQTFDPRNRKDMTRRHSDERIATERGLPEDLEGEDFSYDSDVGMDAIRRDWQSPLGRVDESKLMKMTIEEVMEGFVPVLKKMLEESKHVQKDMWEKILIKEAPYLAPASKKAKQCSSISSNLLIENFGEEAGVINEDEDRELIRYTKEVLLEEMDRKDRKITLEMLDKNLSENSLLLEIDEDNKKNQNLLSSIFDEE